VSPVETGSRFIWVAMSQCFRTGLELFLPGCPVALPAVKGSSMKNTNGPGDELRSEYKRSDFEKLERGKYHQRIKKSSNVVVLDPEVAAVFPNSAAVNKALHSLIEVGSLVSRVRPASKRRSPLRRSNA